MSRTPVILRDAVVDDAVLLSQLWGDIVRSTESRDPVVDMLSIMEQVDANPDERLIVAQYDGHLAGGVFLRIGTLTPLHLEPIVQVISPQVFPQFRRRGVGRALMEAAASFAEDHAVAHVGTASLSTSREANRFMARLGLSPHATLRVTTTQMLRSKLSGQRVADPRLSARQPDRQVSQILAARRSMRRSQILAASAGE